MHCPVGFPTRHFCNLFVFVLRSAERRSTLEVVTRHIRYVFVVFARVFCLLQNRRQTEDKMPAGKKKRVQCAHDGCQTVTQMHDRIGQPRCPLHGGLDQRGTWARASSDALVLPSDVALKRTSPDETDPREPLTAPGPLPKKARLGLTFCEAEYWCFGAALGPRSMPGLLNCIFKTASWSCGVALWAIAFQSLGLGADCH